MLFKKLAAAAASVAVVMTLGTVPSAQADVVSARAAWDSIADQAATKMESLHPVGNPTDPARVYEAWNSAYAAELVAERDGTWAGTADAYLKRAYNARNVSNSNGYGIVNGYGMSQQYATWTSSLNPIDTNYTVTMTDHVGEPFLAAYDAGHDLTWTRARLQEIANALWDMPRWNTGSANPAAAGKCIAYSDSPYDQPAHTNAADRMWCAINVNIGAAAFLQKLADRAIFPTNAGALPADQALAVQGLIQEIYNFTAWAKGQGQPLNSDPNQWAYSFRSIDATFTSFTEKTGNTPQDANHAAYTGESLTALTTIPAAVTMGQNALDDQLAYGNHIPNNTANNDDAANDKDFKNNYEDLTLGKGFDVVGRVRAASVRPLSDTKQTLAEAQWWVNAANAGSVEGSGNAYSWGQIGRWAARLADNATADSEKMREVTFMSAPRVFDYPYIAPGGNQASRTTVVKGAKYHIWIDARFHDPSNNLQFLTNATVRYKKGVDSAANAVFVSEKETGYEWYGARFVWTVTEAVGKDVYICAEVTKDQATPYAPGCRKVTVTAS